MQPTKAEDRKINCGIARDPGMPDSLVKQRRGRLPQKTPIRQPVTIRVDQDVLRSDKSTGKGWQSRRNDVLREGAPK
jgi:uncharacterized protein (DUF4415 family)